MPCANPRWLSLFAHRSAQLAALYEINESADDLPLFVLETRLLGVDAIVGMDILGMGDFSVTHEDGNTVFSFCVPSRRHIDFVAEVQTVPPPAPAKVTIKGPMPSRNGPCPCGSGIKYKGCHGRRK